MTLFQKSVLNKYLKLQDQQSVEKAYKKFTTYFHNVEIQQNIRDCKEEQFQEGFLRELFVNVLGYTLNPQPNYNLTTEFKNEKGAKKADGAILQDGKALAVIELKGTDTKDLDKINIQAFNYKNNQTGCIYVITSNFEKLRFFIHNSVDHAEFNLFTLTETEFELLWLCLNADNLLSGLPLKVKEESVLAEENITKQLYKDYSAFKIDLWQNMVKNSPEADQLLLFKKTQKLLDRFLFIFFSEDSGLLPPNSISRMVKRWEVLKEEDAYKPLYDIFKQYFEYINIGRKGKSSQDDIYAYNGGLFFADDVLNNMVIDDEVLHPHVMKLTAYDFQSEVDVNILGHIFENSLSEIENVIAKLEGQEVDKSKTKRKKDGVFYTPKYITKYIVDNTIGKLCEEKKAELKIIDEEYAKGRSRRRKDTIKKLDKSLQAYRKWLLNVTICDPACGSGAFLNQALDFLIAEHSYIDELESQLLGYSFEFPGVETHILEKNIYGVDINEESIEIAKLSLWLRTAQRGRKLTSLNNNLKCGNSLIDDPDVAGDKAFNWYNEFPQIYKKKEKKAWHVTTAIHNSRYSQRMLDNHVKLDEPIWLSEKDELVITESIAEIVKADKLNMLEYNICGDHMHLMLICEEEELTKIVGKIKSMTARACNIATGRTSIATTRFPIPDNDNESDTKNSSPTRGNIPIPNNEIRIEGTPTRGHAPLSENETAERGKTQTKLWTQKFGKSEIKSENYLNNTIEYILDNRIKHELPKSERIEKIKKDFLCPKNHAFRTEYKGGFDVVIGNPPYVPGKSLDEKFKEYVKTYFKLIIGKYDLYILFIEKILNIINPYGYWGVIIPNTVLVNENSSLIRQEFTKNKTLEKIRLFKDEVFPDASVESVVLISGNEKQNIELIDNKGNQYGMIDVTTIKSDKFNRIQVAISNNDSKVLRKIDNHSIKLGSIADLCIGIQIGGSGKSKDFKEKNISSSKERDNYKKFLDGKDFEPYRINWSGNFLSYGDWLHRKRDEKYFLNDKILIRQIGAVPVATIDKNKFYVLNTIYSLILKDDALYSIDLIFAFINSKLLKFYWEKQFSDNKTLFPKIKKSQLIEIPIKRGIENKIQKHIQEFVTQNVNQHGNFVKILDNFREHIQTKFSIEKLSTKLQNWYKLDFKDLFKELKKAKVKLSLSKEAEWMQYFTEQKQKAQEIKAEIEKTDKKIDQMVYELYGLTEEEIKIVEGRS